MSRSASVSLSRRERRAKARLEQPSRRSRPRQRAGRPACRSPFFIVSAVAILVGAAAVAIATRPPAPSGDLVRGATSYPADLTDGTTLGSVAAPVEIELYADFQCPACRQFVTLELPQLVTDYVRTGAVRIVAHDIDVLGRGSPDESIELAVGASCAGEQDRYWQFHDLVFWNQGRENRGDHDAAFIATVADQAGVDRAAWDACIARSDVRQAIIDRTAEARAQGIAATPTLRVNGTVMVGVPAYAELAALIDRLVAGSPAAS
jgi:protein-disulfide isomerase